MTITPDTILRSPAVRQRLSNRAYNAITIYCVDDNCERRYIKTIGELAEFTERQVQGFRYVGKVTLAELTELIREAGLEWGTPPAEQPKAAPPEPKAALAKVVQLTTAGEYLYALLDDGTIWWTATVGRSWSYMVPPPPCTSPNQATVLAARLQAIWDRGRRQVREAVTPSQPMSPDNHPA